MTDSYAIPGHFKWCSFTLLFSLMFFVSLVPSSFSHSDSNLRCLVCQQVVDSMVSSIENEDPKKKIQVGSFRIQPDGSQKKTEIKYAGSETHIHEILESVCDVMSDYAQAKNKETGELALLNLSKDIQKLSTHELVPDSDLNRSLKHYCEGFIEEYEDDILEGLNESKSRHDIISYLCKSKAGYCKTISSNKEHGEL